MYGIASSANSAWSAMRPGYCRASNRPGAGLRLARRHLPDRAAAAADVSRDVQVAVRPLDRAAQRDAVRQDRRREGHVAVAVDEHHARLGVLRLTDPAAVERISTAAKPD